MSLRLLRLLLSLYPAAFRARFGAEMLSSFESRLAAARTDARTLAAAYRTTRLWITFTREILCCATLEHLDRLRSGAPERRPLGNLALPRFFDASSAVLRQAVRQLIRAPGFLLLAIPTLAIAIGSVTAILSLVDHVLVRSLPYESSERLVRVWLAREDGSDRFLESTMDEFEALRERAEGFAELTAISAAPRDLTDDVGTPRTFDLGRVSYRFLPTLGVEPILGRGFSPEEIRESSPVVLLAQSTWLDRYGGRLDILQQEVRIQGEPHRIVGVLGENVDLPRGVALWRPFTADENVDDDRELIILGRLARNVDPAAASAEVGRVLALHGAPTERSEATTVDSLTGWVEPLQSTLARPVRRPLWLLLAAVASLLLIACGNVAMLQLARGVRRRRAWAVCSALGAGRGRLMAQSLLESIILAGAGGALGLLFGKSLLHTILWISPVDLPRLAEVELDLRITLAIALVTGFCGVLTGLAPALRSSHLRLADALRASRGASADGAAIQQVLVVAQLALATLLLVGGLLFASSFVHRIRAERGFTTENLITLQLSPPRSSDTFDTRATFYERVRGELESMPGVRSAALTNFLPSRTDGFRMPFEFEGVPPLDLSVGNDSPRSALLRTVTPEFFQTAGLSLRAGQPFSRLEAHGVAVVNEAFVRTFLPSRGHLSAHIGTRLSHRAYFEGQPSERTILGIVEDARPDGEPTASPRIYVPYRQFPWPRMTLLLRHSGSESALAAAIRDRVWAIDPTVPLDDLRTMEDLVLASAAQERFLMRVVGAFACFAALLAGLGVFGVVSGMVATRRGEIGIRMALGADRARIVRLVFRQGLTLGITGITLGLGSAIALERFVESLAWGIEPTDPRLLATAALSLGVLALLVCLEPAARAARIDPARVLGRDG